jgi:hypothetical protein
MLQIYGFVRYQSSKFITYQRTRCEVGKQESASGVQLGSACTACIICVYEKGSQLKHAASVLCFAKKPVITVIITTPKTPA